VIQGGRFEAVGFGGAGIGAGIAESGRSVVENLTIATGFFNASGRYGGSGIGGGISDGGFSIVSQVAITSGVFIVVGSPNSTAIGAGLSRFGISAIGSLHLHGGFFNTTAGINAPAIGGNRTNITVGPSSNYFVIDCYAQGSCFTGASINVTNVNFSGFTSALTFWGARTVFSGASVRTQYRNPSTREPLEGIDLLHFGTVPINGTTAVLSLRKSDGVGVNATFIGRVMKGLAVSLPSPGDYHVSIFNDGKPSGEFCLGQQNRFPVVDGDNFFDHVVLCRPRVTDSGGAPGDQGISTLTIALIGGAVGLIVIIVVVGCVLRRRERADTPEKEPIILHSGVSSYTV
jgi:hypothetical protein